MINRKCIKIRLLITVEHFVHFLIDFYLFCSFYLIAIFCYLNWPTLSCMCTPFEPSYLKMNQNLTFQIKKSIYSTSHTSDVTFFFPFYLFLMRFLNTFFMDISFLGTKPADEELFLPKKKLNCGTYDVKTLEKSISFLSKFFYCFL